MLPIRIPCIASGRRVTLALAASLVLGSTALAHHSGSQFDRNLRVDVAGAITKVDWTNPHVWLYVAARDEHGADVEWEFELPSMNRLLRLGWKRQQLKAGDRIEVLGFRARNHPGVAIATHVTDSGGRALFVGSPD